MKRIIRQLRKKPRHVHLYSHMTNDHEFNLRELDEDELLLIATGRIRSLRFLPVLERKYKSMQKLHIVRELIKKRPGRAITHKIMSMVRHTLGLQAKPYQQPTKSRKKGQNYYEVYFG
jgi:hypothetical protein